MRALITAIGLSLAAGSVQAADLSTREINRIQEAATVLKEIHDVPDKDIPQELWERADLHGDRQRQLREAARASRQKTS